MRIKDCFLVVVLALGLVMPATTQANLLINGDFESGPGVGWTPWWGGNSGIADHSADYGGPSPNMDAGIWWLDDGFLQEVTIGPGLYTLEGDLINSHLAPLGNGRRTILKAEIGLDGAVWWTQEAFIDETAPIDTWQHVSFDIDNTAAGANWVKVVLMQWDDYGWGSGQGNSYFDNIQLTPEPTTLALLGLGSLLVVRRRR